MARDLSGSAESAISDALYNIETLDIDALREAVSDQVASAAENACIYTHACLEIISDYERDVDDGEVADMLGDRTFTAGDWSDAMVVYANAVAYVWLSAKVSELIDEIEESADDMETAIGESVELRISTDCPHGWAVHAKEDENGIHYWEPAQLEGCRAWAVKVAGIWLSYTVSEETETEGEG